jgi:hypothetical protein
MASATARTPAPRNLQLRVGAVMLDAGQIAMSEIRAAFPDLTGKQLGQCMFQMRTAQRAKKLPSPSGEVWQLTLSGKAWVKQGGGRRSALAEKEEPEPAKAPRKAKASKKAKAKPVKATRRGIGRAASEGPTDIAFQPLASSKPITVRAATPQVVSERSFRCAVFSDGAFHLAKNGQAIDLTAAEFAEALRYVERMAEQPAP